MPHSEVMPPHDYPYYWVILDPKSKENKVKVINLKNLPKFQISYYKSTFVKITTSHHIILYGIIHHNMYCMTSYHVILSILSQHNTAHHITSCYVTEPPNSSYHNTFHHYISHHYTTTHHIIYYNKQGFSCKTIISPLLMYLKHSRWVLDPGCK